MSDDETKDDASGLSDFSHLLPDEDEGVGNEVNSEADELSDNGFHVVEEDEETE